MYSGTKEFNAGDTVYFPQNGYWMSATVTRGCWLPAHGQPDFFFLIEVSVNYPRDDKFYYYYVTPANLYSAKEVFMFRLRGILPAVKEPVSINGAGRGHCFPYVALDGDLFFHEHEQQLFMYSAPENSWLRILADPTESLSPAVVQETALDRIFETEELCQSVRSV
jgi:hypothetical protein